MSQLYDALKKAESVKNPVDSVPAPQNGLQKVLSDNAIQIFSGIYGNLLPYPGSPRPRTLLVCSASKGEGVTTVAAGLAIAAAGHSDEEVLLVDGNFRNSTLSRSFGLLDESPGLTEALNGGPAGSLAQETTIPHLSLMAAGSSRAHSSRDLEPPKFRHLLDSLVRAYSLIVVDGPAIHSSAESVLYASQVDRALLVVHAGRARSPVVAKALSKLAAAGCDKIEVILNRRTFPIPQKVYQRL